VKPMRVDRRHSDCGTSPVRRRRLGMKIGDCGRDDGHAESEPTNVEIRREMARTLILAALVAWTLPVIALISRLIPAVTQETLATTICAPGWTKTVRPSAWETGRIKIKLIRELELPESF